MYSHSSYSFAAYYLHPGFQHEDELAYRDDLLGAVTSVVDRMSQSHEKAAATLNELKYFREGIGSFGEPSAIASRQKLDPDMSYLRDDEDPMVSWVSRSTTERGEMELDEEADDPDDPPRPNTFLVSAIKRMQAGGDARVAEDTPVGVVKSLQALLEWVFLRASAPDVCWAPPEGVYIVARAAMFSSVGDGTFDWGFDWMFCFSSRLILKDLIFEIPKAESEGQRPQYLKLFPNA
ncbi:hypothetical protein Taro_037452 [Colocasia esculenta]|uniref:Uncharacterized protein n=1 Tax=Colocasia esculenta TaxID=4460 RepID=A0A843WPR1_COLES|nr:hypothetical protein [Colocasia esculenta]